MISEIVLRQALVQGGIPGENHDQVWHLAQIVDVADAEVQSSRVKLIRTSGKPPVYVQSGYSNGLSSEEEARAVAEGEEVWPSRIRHGAWGVNHHKTGPDRFETARTPLHSDAVCPVCTMQRSLTGECDCW